MIKNLMIALVFALAVVGTSYFASYYYVSHGKPLIEIIGKPYVTDTDQKPLTSPATIKMGRAIIVHVKAFRRAMDCYADYYTVMRHEVHSTDDIQFPPRRTSIMVKADGEVSGALHLDLPTDMTPGRYHLQQVAYPTCSSISLPMFDTGLDLWVDVVR